LSQTAAGCPSFADAARKEGQTFEAAPPVMLRRSLKNFVTDRKGRAFPHGARQSRGTAARSMALELPRRRAGPQLDAIFGIQSRPAKQRLWTLDVGRWTLLLRKTGNSALARFR